MKKTLLIFLFAASVWGATSNTHAPAEWHFALTFPGEPIKSENRTARGDLSLVEERVHFEKDAHVWAAIRVSPLAIPPERIAAAYEGGKRSLFRARPGRLLEEEVIDLHGHPGRRYRLAFNDGTRVADHRVVFVGDSLYQFMFERPAEATPDTDDEFFASIVLQARDARDRPREK